MHKMKKILLSISIAIFTIAFVNTAQAVEWKGWNIHVPGYPNTVGMDKFAEILKERTNGRITLKMFHSGVLGSQPDAIEQVRVGGLQIGNFNMGPMGPIIPEANVLSLPFIFKDTPHMFRVMNGAAGEQINAGMAKKGLIGLAWYDSGARSFYTTKKPVTEPKDVQGMKIRVMNNDLYVGMIAALGGNGTPMAFSEVFTSLKQGVVDGAENNWPSYESTRHFENAKYYSTTQHLMIPECVCINADVYSKLSDEDKKIVKEAALESAELQQELWAKRSKASRDKVTAAGVQVTEIKDKAPFMKAMEPVHAAFLEKNPSLKSLVELIKNTD
ncbi:MAG: TRAP transporter substrate-binding protein [SAR324 cluster bacterium]|nr:TRAP transporter substrate-binding protein [SAR324 cluster bacterium]